MTVDVKAAIQTSLRNHILLSVALIVLLLGGIAAWASTTQISGAVVAPGSVVVDSSAKKVQHPTGGIVSDLRVHDGDRVRAGDVLVRLDETVPRANLAIVSKDLDQLYAQKARLEAERDGLRQGTGSTGAIKSCKRSRSRPRSPRRTKTLLHA